MRQRPFFFLPAVGMLALFGACDEASECPPDLCDVRMGQIHQGLAGVIDQMGDLAGRVSVSQLSPTHFLEEWFLHTEPEAFEPGQSFTVDANNDVQDALGLIQFKSYVEMDVVYESPPPAQLTTAPGDAVYWAFEVRQLINGQEQVTAALLRERRDGPNGPEYTDYWSFGPDFLLVKQRTSGEGEYFEAVPLPGDAPPPHLWYDATATDSFAEIHYQVESYNGQGL